LTEFSIRPMLSPRLKEVYVNEAVKNLTIAVLMTIADAAFVIWYCGVIYQALSPIIWTRILILLLATLWALSLARIWARAIYSLRQRSRSRSIEVIPGTAITSIDLRREGDV
jgi:ABC-type bacteriocin/lantibiotic exporter with double-glycine peptidase domain